MRRLPISQNPLVCFVVPDLSCGGTERATLSIIRGLLARGYRIDLLSLYSRVDVKITGWIPDGVGLFAGGNSADGAEVFAALPPRPARFLGDCLRLARKMRYLPRSSRARESRIVANYIAHRHPDIIMPALNRPIIASTLACHLLEQTPPIVPIIHLGINLKKSHRRRLMQHTARVVTVSQGLIAELIRQSGLPVEHFTTIYNPVIMPEMAVQKEEIPAHPWFLDDGAPIILGCGRLTAQEGFDVLIRAFARLSKSRPCRLIVLGEGDRGKLKRLATDIGIADNISMPGWADNPFAYMSHAQLFVLSSNFEGFGLVLAEALACGCPCVSTDCVSGPSEILQGGEFGELVPVGDDRALAEAMRRTLDNPPPKEKLVARGEYFSFDRAAGAYDQLIREVLR